MSVSSQSSRIRFLRRAAADVLAVSLALSLTGCGRTARNPNPPGGSAATPERGSAQPAAAEPLQLSRLTALSFLDARTGWVSGYANASDATASQGTAFASGTGAQLAATTDGGRTWTRVAVPGDNPLRLLFVDAQHGWALAETERSGYNYKSIGIFATTDGGKTWQQQWTGTRSADLDSLLVRQRVTLSVFGLEKGYALVGGTLLTTADGGRAWQAVSFPSTGFRPVHMSFADSLTGWVAGEEGSRPVLLSTADGGASWKTSFRPETQVPYLKDSASVSFADDSHGWLYLKGDDFSSRFYSTSDGGRTWNLLTQGVAGGRPVAAPLIFLDTNTGYMGVSAGAGPIPGTILVTRDGGRSWKGIGEGRDWSIEGLVMDSLQDGWAMGSSPGKRDFLLHTEDGWASWQQVLPGLTPTQDVSFLDASRGFGIGTASDPSALVRTEDGGATWSLVDAKLTRPLAISFVDAGSGWAVAENSASARQILHTGDGGRTWTPTAALPVDQANGLAPFYPYLRFFSASEGLVEPQEWPQTTVARSRDGGKTWSPQGLLTRKPGSWIKVAFATPDHGFAAVQNPREGFGTDTVTLQKTDDGGRTWANLPALEGDYWVQGLAFPSADRAFLLVLRDPLSPQPTAQLLQTADGGKTWQTSPVTAGDANPLPDAPPEATRLFFVDNSHGWILTPGGMLATRDGGRTWSVLP